jgi:hypothetical protein
MDKSVGILAETGSDCCDLEVAFQYGDQSKLIVNDLRKQVHKLLFTDMKGLAEAVELRRGFPLGVEFPSYDSDVVTPRNTPSADKDEAWAFTIASVSDKGTVSYYAFKIDWSVVAANIVAGMKKEMAKLASMFPGSNKMPPALEQGAFKSSELMTLRKDALGLSGLFPDTVAPEALFVRHAYLALRQPKPADVDDAKAQKQVVDACWKAGDTKATYKVVYIAGPEGAPLRRKP